MKDTQTSTYELTISYVSEGSPAVTLLDTIPAELTNVAADAGGACLGGPSVERASAKTGKGATKIACDLPAATDAELVVTFETRESPGRGHKEPAFVPTSCEPLALNDGAVAVDLTDPDAPVIVAGATPMLTVDVADLRPDADPDGDGVDCRFEGQDEVLVRREGDRVILEPADAGSEAFLPCLGQWKEPIERLKQEPLCKVRDPFA